MKGFVTRKGKSWYVVLELDRDSTGKRCRKWLSVRKELHLSKPATKKQAEDLLVMKLGELQQGTYFEPSLLSLEDYLTQWLEDYGKSNLRQSTRDSYESFIRLHIKPTLGNILLKDLRPSHVQKLYTQKKDELSNRSIRYIHSILNKAIRQAIKWEYVARNVMEAVTAPALKQSGIRRWDAEQVLIFLDAAKTEHFTRCFF